MSQIFIETIAKAIGDYRFMLRRHLNPEERRQKLAVLNLKDPTLFDSAPKLFEVANRIVKDIESYTDTPQSYYAYSGIMEFGKYLKEYLAKYEVQDNRVVHCAQKASKAIIEAIQLLALSENRMDTAVAAKLNKCSAVVVEYGSQEQIDMYEATLKQKLMTQREFFTPIYDFFEKLTQSEGDGGTHSGGFASREQAAA